LEQTREQFIVFAQGYYGIFRLAEYSLLVGVKLKDRPPAIGMRQEIWPNTGSHPRLMLESQALNARPAKVSPILRESHILKRWAYKKS
jgi:hypothetical protein